MSQWRIPLYRIYTDEEDEKIVNKVIKRGDTLGTISSDTYGTMKFWRNIWDNNRPLIKDPNVIFAGFTIYTPILQARDVAFEDI